MMAMGDGRKTPRRRVLKLGRISFGGAAIDCTVRNLSERGAALDVASPIGIPDTFILVLESEHDQRPCRVVWRKESRIGVAFEA